MKKKRGSKANETVPHKRLQKQTIRTDNTAVLIKKALESVDYPKNSTECSDDEGVRKIKFVDRQQPFKPKPSYKQRSARTHKASKELLQKTNSGTQINPAIQSSSIVIQTAASVDYFSRNKQSNAHVFTDLQSETAAEDVDSNQYSHNPNLLKSLAVKNPNTAVPNFRQPISNEDVYDQQQERSPSR